MSCPVRGDRLWACQHYGGMEERGWNMPVCGGGLFCSTVAVLCLKALWHYGSFVTFWDDGRELQNVVFILPF